MRPKRRSHLLAYLTWELTSMAASEGWGPDMDWFASDRDGHLAVLTTAGLGAVPVRVTADPTGLLSVIADLEQIRRWTYDVKSGVLNPGRLGAFGFDYGAHGRVAQYVAGNPYRRNGAEPSDPLSVAHFGPEANHYLKEVRFRELCFAEVAELDVENSFESIHRPTRWDEWSNPDILRPVAPRPTVPSETPPRIPGSYTST